METKNIARTIGTQDETRENEMIRQGKKAFSATCLVLVLLASSVALAQNECTPVGTDPSDNGATADSFVCDGPIGTYTGGVTYDSDGDLTVESTVDNNEFGGNGIVLTSNGVDNVNFISDGVEIEGRALDGALLDIGTNSGDIDILTEAVDADAHSAALATHGIRTQSVSGDIVITTTGSVTVGNGTDSSIGIEAITSGNIDITTPEDAFRSVEGARYGVLAETSGSGNLTFSGSAYTDEPNGIAALDLTTEMGLLTVNITGSVDNDSFENAAAIRVTTDGGNALINLLDCRNCSAQVGDQGESNENITVLDVNMNGGTTTINNNAEADAGFGNHNTNMRDEGLLQASGSGSIVFNNNIGRIVGQMRLADFDGDFTLNNHSGLDGWTVRGVNDFTQGNDTVNNMADAIMVFGSIDNSIQSLFGEGEFRFALQTTPLNFGEGQNVFNNAGTLVVGMNESNQLPIGKTLVFSGLDTFNNSGTIVLGSEVLPSSSFEADAVAGNMPSDGFYDDVLVFQDGTFVGGEGSRILLDASFNNVGQTSCARNAEGLPDNGGLENQEDGFLAANDCLDFRGSAISGRTDVVINDVIPGDRGAYNPDGNVIVDAVGGEAHPNAFVLSPDNVGYSAVGGGVIDKGLFNYAIGYDTDSQQYKLFGVESPGALQLALLGQAANELWRTTTGSWFDRQDALRDRKAAPDRGVGIWFRGSTTTAERTVQDNVPAGANILEFDNSYTQDNSSATFGADLGPHDIFGGHWSFGGMVGYARARVNYDAHPNSANLEGVHAGLYSHYVLGRFFANLAVNQTWLDMHNDVPALELSPEGTVLSTDVESLGGRFEAGWRFRLLDRLDVEPLASISKVTTSLDDIRVPADDPLRFGGTVRYDDPESLRAGLGVRLAMRDVLPGFAPTDVRLTTRVLNESEGESSASIENVGPTAAPVSDTFDGTFTEVSGGVSIRNTRETVSGFLDVDAAFGDDYDSLGFTTGVRVQW